MFEVELVVSVVSVVKSCDYIYILFVNSKTPALVAAIHLYSDYNIMDIFSSWNACVDDMYTCTKLRNIFALIYMQMISITYYF